MEYTINKLAKMSGISTRTLRYYDQIGLLRPARVSSNGYRIYGQEDVDRLQQILFYRELGVALEEIGQILSDPGYDRGKALESHLSALLQKKDQIERLIDNVTKTIGTMKGETRMSDSEKFEGFKQKLVEDNERLYGGEIREKYGADAVNVTNRKVRDMSKEQWQNAQRLEASIHENLKMAMEQGEPVGETAQKACELHRQWLQLFWADGTYSKQAHLGLAEMYCADERFKAYYDAVSPGAAEFLLEAMKTYCRE